jgi:glycosyltransferase involved in cell wall biosynthesis
MKRPVPKRIAVNLLYVDEGHLTGPGYYAVQLLEHMTDLLPLEGPLSLCAYVRPSARHHFSTEAQPYLRDISFTGGRFKRVMMEQVTLPFRAKRDRISLLFSPTFVSPMWGAKHLAVTVIDMYYRVTPEFTERFQRRYWAVMIPLSVRVCDIVLAISDSVASDIRQYLPAARHKTVAVPLASRLSAPSGGQSLSPAQVGDAPFILMVANVTPNKNPQVVAKAIAELSARGRRVRLIHAGQDNLGLLARSIENHGMEGSFTSLGKVSDEKLMELYRGCLASVVPSFYEGFGMPAVEAQSQGAPLLCSNRGSLPEAGGDAALYFDPDDCGALVAHIEDLIDNPDMRNDVIARGYDSAARFSWHRTARETIAALSNVLGSGSDDR